MKVCTKCGEMKQDSDFYLRTETGNLRSACKSCTEEVSLKYRRNNTDRIAAYHKRTYPRNREKILAQSKKWHAENKEKSVISTRKWQRANPEASRKWKRMAYATRQKYRTEQCLRSRLARAVTARRGVKAGSTMSLLGCPWVWLEVHLESLFRPGMTWENHGPVWHIDHIKPCAAFDLSVPEQQRICFHWTNLQPLFASENMSKGAKYNG